MRDLFQDLQYGLRVFRSNPTFTLIALLALALGIGATTAIFSVVDTVLLKPLPYPQSDRIVSAGLTLFGENSLALAPDYLEWRARNHVFEEMAACGRASPTLTSAGEPTVLKCGRATRSFFRTFRVHGHFAPSRSILIAVALLASYIPALRATRVDPVNALRCE